MPFAPDILLQRLALLVLVGGPAWAAWRLTMALWADAPTSRRIVAGLSLWMLLVWAMVMVLGNAMLLSAVGLVATSVVVAAAGEFAVRRLATKDTDSSPSEASPWSPWWLVPCVGVLPFTAAGFYFNGIELFSDDLAYHFVVVAEWVRRGSLFHPTISLAHYYPFNPHVVAAAFVTITRSVDEAWIPALYWIVLATAAMLGFASVAPRAAAPLALAAVVFLTSNLWFAGNFCSPDLAGGASLLVAFLFMAARAGASTKERRADAVLAALMAGFAVGCKPSLVVPGAVAALAIALSLWRVDALRGERLRWIGFAAAAFLATASYWYARNWIVAGNPLYPFRIASFYGSIEAKHIRTTTIWHWVTQSPGEVRVWLDAVRGLIDWPMANGLIAAVGLAAGVALLATSLLRQRVGRAPLLPAGAGWMVAAAVLFLAFHITAPFSGGTLNATAMTIYARYVMVAYLAGLVLAAMGASLIVPGTTAINPGQRASSSWHDLLRVAPVAVLLALRPWLVATPAVPLAMAPEQTPLRGGVAALELLPDGARIAALSTRTWENGYLYGSRLQHQPVWIDENGVTMPPLHTMYNWQRRKMKQDYPRFGIVYADATVSDEQFVANLRASRIDYLFVTQYSFGAPTWSPLRAAVAASPLMRKVHDDGFTEIYTWRATAEETP